MVLEMRKQARLTQVQLARKARLRRPKLKALEDALDSVDPTIHDILRVAVACGFDLRAVVSRPRSRAAPLSYAMRPSDL
jgi:DNA-binding phage protein